MPASTWWARTSPTASRRWWGFWWGLVLAPPIVGVMGAAFERYALRRVHKFGHVPELLITFGLSYLISRGGATGLGPPGTELPAAGVAAGPAVHHRRPAHLAGARLGRAARGLQVALPGPSAPQFPQFRAFGMGVAVLMLVAVWLLLTRTRIGLVIQAALTHPDAVEALGHNVPRVFMMVFGGGTALAALAGVIGGMRCASPSLRWPGRGRGGVRRHRDRRHGIAGGRVSWPPWRWASSTASPSAATARWPTASRPWVGMQVTPDTFGYRGVEREDEPGGGHPARTCCWC